MAGQQNSIQSAMELRGTSGSGSVTRRAWLALAGLLFVSPLLAGCDAVEEKYSWNQKLTVEVDTPQGVRTGSSVINVWAKKHLLSGLINYERASDRTFGMHGEATVVEVAPGKYLFVLLSGGSRAAQVLLAWSVFADHAPATNGDNFFSGAKAFVTLEETRPLEPKLYPLMVTFADINDPKTISIVDPENLAASFGEGVSINGMTVGIVHEKVTKGAIDPFVPWVAWPREKLLASGAGINPMRIKVGDLTYIFDQTNFKMD